MACFVRPGEVACIYTEDPACPFYGTAQKCYQQLCIVSYLNFLITNGGVIVPQYGDKNDALALEQIRQIFPDREVVGVYTREIVYGGDIHCITQQQPVPKMVQKDGK